MLFLLMFEFLVHCPVFVICGIISHSLFPVLLCTPSLVYPVLLYTSLSFTSLHKFFFVS